MKRVIRCKKETYTRSEVIDPEEGEDDYKCSGLLLTKIIKKS